jgi:hypothetical protein
MNDADVLSHIDQCVRREHELLDKASSGKALTADERKELDEVQVQLDRYYDLLRQRRAREEFGQDPDETEMRSGKTVERYLQ